MTDQQVRHGTYSGYFSGCRCDECRAHMAAVARRYRRNHGCDYLVDAEPIRRHLVQLRRCGYSNPELARLTGINVVSLRKIINGKQSKVRHSTAEKIFSLTGRAISEQQCFDPQLFNKTVEKYLDLGLTGKEIAKITGIDSSIIYRREFGRTKISATSLVKLFSHLDDLDKLADKKWLKLQKIPDQDFAAFIREARASGLSMPKIAKLLKVSKNTLWNILSGKQPSLPVQERIASHADTVRRAMKAKRQQS